MPHGGLSGASRGPRTPPGPHQKPQNPYVLQGPIERPLRDPFEVCATRAHLGSEYTRVPGVYLGPGQPPGVNNKLPQLGT